MQFARLIKLSNQKSHHHSWVFLFIFILSFFSFSFINAQNHELLHPYSELDFSDLRDMRRLGIENAINDLNGTDFPINPNMFSNGVIPEIGNADFLTAQEYAVRQLENDSFYDYALLVQLSSADDDNPVYRYTLDDRSRGIEPQYLGTVQEIYPDLNSAAEFNFTTVLFTEYAFIGSFYNSLPDALIGYSSNDESFNLIMGFIREPQTSQALLNTALEKFKRSRLAQDPFVKLGLQAVNDIVLIEADSDNNQFTGAPSQFNSLENTIYINPTDLSQYGNVLLFHELLQAGLFNALTEKYISVTDFEKLKNLDKKYFSHLGISYVNTPNEGLEGLSVLTALKAFAIGYTYKILENEVDNETPTDRSQRVRFLADVKYNTPILDMEIDIGFATATHSMHLIRNPLESDQSDTDYFISMFTDDSSPVNQEIQVVLNKIKKRQGKDDYIKILPALNLLLAD